MSETGARRASRRIDDIEVLRAAAVIFVILSHVDFVYDKPCWLILQIQARGVRFFDGVDLFLVISGFVIGRNLLPQLGPARLQPRIGVVLAKFFTRRIWRLWPAAWLWLVIVLAASIIVHLPTTLGTPRENAFGAVSAVALFANLRFASDATSLHYFGAAFPYWSLSLEEQFYLVLPPLILISGRFLPFVLASGILIEWPLAHDEWLQALRTAALMWGVCLALFERTTLYRRAEPVILRRSAILSASVTAALLFWLARGTHNAAPAPRFEFGDIAFISAILVWLASYDRGYICPFAWPKPTLLWAGARSYSIYLVHIPGAILANAIVHWLALTLPLAPRPEFWFAIATDGAIVAALAEATYRFIEQPCRRYGVRLSDKIGLPPETPSMARIRPASRVP